MAVAIGLWSQVLVPGEEEVIVPQADLRITNVALGDVIADASGRTTIKFTYNALVRLESDDEDEAAPEPTLTTVLCSLSAGKVEQVTTDIILEQDEEYTFNLVGKNTVYLTGNYIDQTPPDNAPFGGDDSDMGSEDAYDLRDLGSDIEMDAEELDDASRFEEVVEETVKTSKRPRDSDVDVETIKPTKADKKSNKKLKAHDGKAVEAVAEAKDEEKKVKKDKKKEEKKEKPAATPTEKEIAGGIKVLDTKIGTGPTAKKGSTVLMRYIGKLQNGKVFDKNVKGKPFTFHLGKGEVIKGWDEGIAGMQVGGERKLTIPPNLAYGKKGVDGIPANSTLIFECKLMELK